MRHPASGSDRPRPEPVRLDDFFRTIGVALAAAAWSALPASAGAADIRISGGACAGTVRLVARDAPLSDVLGRLASEYGFKLSYQSESDPLVDYSGESDLTAMLARLVPQGNVSIATGQVAACAGRSRVTSVWILPDASRRATVSAVVRANAHPPRKGRPRLADAPVDPLYAQSHGAAVSQQSGNPR